MDYVCKWCNEIKPEQEFLRRKAAEPYSASNIRCCRTCNQARNKARYEVPEIRDKQLAANANWRKANPEKMEAFKVAFHAKNPRNQQARNKVAHMLRRGYWTKQPCEVCGSTVQLEAHHDSYAKAHWTTVRWLCKTHHEMWHRHLDPVKTPLLEPLARVEALREEHDAIQRQMADLRRRAASLKKEADALEFDTWSAVQKLAIELFPRVMSS